MNWAPSGPGVIGFNLVGISPNVINAVFLQGDQSQGVPAGMITSAPEINKDPDVQNYLDNAVGLPAEFKGSKQPGMITAEASVEVTAISPETIGYYQPGLTRSDWMGSTNATLAVGSGNSRYSVTAKASGTAGNSVSITQTIPAAAQTGVTVSVSGNAITVTLNSNGAAAPVTTSTANDVIAAINAHVGASALVRAGLSGGSTGAGVQAALAATNLAGGAAGTRVGYKFADTGIFKDRDYLSNVVVVLPTTNQDVYYVCAIKNAINTEAWNPSFDENGAVSGVSVTWRGHITKDDRDPSTGAYSSPLDQYLMDVSVPA